ncbi:Protein S-acyltransferase 10, partial [Ananas comosus]
CTVVYFLLLLATVFQYFLTSRSSPGNVLDAMKIATETHVNSTQSAPGTGNMSTSWRNGSSLWSKLVTDLYPPGLPSRITTCADCHTIQPPRSKHCHDCHQCVLRFDHHCLWLGTCIGKGNHSRYWWYIFEETILCIWTRNFVSRFPEIKSYESMVQHSLFRVWKDFFGTVMFVVLIICLLPLLALLLFQRGAPAGIHPFRKVMWRKFVFILLLMQ